MIPGSAQLWHRLTHSPQTIAGPQRHRIHLLLSLLVIVWAILALYLLTIPFQLVSAPDKQHNDRITIFLVFHLVVLIPLALSYLLARRGHYLASAHVLVATVSSIAFMEILSTRTTVMIDMPVVAIVLCGIMLSPIETLGAYVVTVAGYGILGATIFSAASWNPVDSIALSTVVGGMSYAISFLHARNIDEINEQATELASYEVSLVVARKKETIARLSAGIAHEFNNILMIVSGNAEILESTTNVIAVECAQRIRRSTGHAAHLVETVLSLSEQQMLRLTTFDLDEAMAHQQELLQAAMGGNIAILLRRSSESKIVQIDEKLFFDAARILARKAQEGLEGHGVVTIRTGAVNLGPGDADHLPAGPYAVVTIGNGRPAGPEDRVFAPFDPFFLTGCIGNRELDLLAADGIVRQCKGRIELGRDPELGNTFVIMVPRQPSVTA